MGAGIAQVAAAAGHVVKLLDNRPEAAAKAVAGIRPSSASSPTRAS
jgi:3-hydroxybutyryl-CoA dehydrogenase